MTNTKLLKIKMLEAGDDHPTNTLAKVLDISLPTASSKLNGKAQFAQGEIIELAIHYGWDYEVVGKIFLGDLRRQA